MKCPCSSGDAYAHCCQPFHQGKLPKEALQLMRSRYSAYALGLADYLIQTTHPASPRFHHDIAHWREQLSAFCGEHKFPKLEILDVREGDSTASVTFIAHILHGEEDVSFTERSFFDKRKGRWLYRSGHLSEGHAPNLATLPQLRLLPLAYYGDSILRKVAAPIAEITEDLRTLIEEMVETMDGCDGMGIAAPQVHHSIQLFVIRRPVENANGNVDLKEVKVFINPKLSQASADTWKVAEGCLSIPSIRGEVERSKEITIEYTDSQGNRLSERVSGWEARVVMHETDHLNGILFIDHLGTEKRRKLEPFLKALENRIHDGTEL